MMGREIMGMSWNSFPLEISYLVLGWIAFISWSFSFYPQVILNFRRKSVVGLSFDYAIMNLIKHSSYLIYNATLYFSYAVQQQYREKFGLDEMIPVSASDVAFSVHAVLLTAFILFQIIIYERGNQKVSKTSILIVTAILLSAGISVFIALPTHSWLSLISIFNMIQVFMTMIKYIPQVFMNICRKSTEGFSIHNYLLDFTGSVTNLGQMAAQSLDQGSLVNFHGNLGKTLLSLVCIFYDALFFCQHYVIYPGKEPIILTCMLDHNGVKEPLKKNSSDVQTLENV